MEDQLAVEHDHPTPPLEGSTTLDVCIVGGGLTGLWTALRIRELDPSCSVGVIEADICGSGASGSNGGFAMTWWPKIATLKKLMGSDDAIRMARDSEAAVADMGRFCHEHAIGADFKSAGWLWAATNEVQLGSWDETLKVLDAMGARPFERVSADEAVSMSGSDRHLGGVYESGVATVQPAALVRGLRAVALRQGVSVWEHSPMTSFESAHDNVTITTPRGAVRAKTSRPTVPPNYSAVNSGRADWRYRTLAVSCITTAQRPTVGSSLAKVVVGSPFVAARTEALGAGQHAHHS
jgi:glycine/D-amino acid oxidase-like deaminating enzyme